MSYNLPISDEEVEIYNRAEKDNSWVQLIPYRKLLFLWQKRHPQDVIKIAKVGSHRSGIHRWCGDKCQEIGAWIKEKELEYGGIQTPS